MGAITGTYNAISGYNLGSVSPTYNGYLDRSDKRGKEMRQMKEWFYQSNYPQNAAFWQQGYIDKQFKAGNQAMSQWMYGDNNWMRSRRFFFNLCRRQSNMICGYQSSHRKSTVAMPVLPGMDQLADDWNAVFKYCENRDGFQEYFSQAFEGAVDTGLYLLWMYPDYTFDPISGDLCTDSVSWNNFLIDAHWRKMDFSDCRGIWRRKWVSRETVKSLIPGYANELNKIPFEAVSNDGKFPLQAELLNLNVAHLAPYDEFHYQDTREATLIIDPYTGEAEEFRTEEGKENEEELKEILRQAPWLKVKKQQIPTVRLSLSISGVEVYDGPNLLMTDRYPCVPSVTYHEPDINIYAWRCQGIIRNIRDAQWLYNMRKVIEMDILQSQVNSGWIYKVDRVVDEKAFRQSGQGFVIPLKSNESPINDSVQRIEAPGLPPSILELSRALAEDIPKITGVNEELLGSATDDKAGILSALRQGAGLTTLHRILDKADYTQRLYGQLRMEAVQNLFTAAKIRNILGREPDPGFFSKRSLKYSIAVEEGNYSVTQRQMELQQKLHFRELGVPIANEDILDSAFITNKKTVIANMKRNEQAQMQQQQQQAENERMESMSRSRMDIAKEQDLMASAMERRAKVDEAEANVELRTTEAELNLVKQLVELDNLDLEHMRRSLELAYNIKNDFNQEKKNEKGSQRTTSKQAHGTSARKAKPSVRS